MSKDKSEFQEIKYLIVEEPEIGGFSIWLSVAPFSGEKDCMDFIKDKFPEAKNIEQEKFPTYH